MTTSRLEKLQKMLERDPHDVDLHYMVAMEYKGVGDLDRAIAAFDTCIEKNRTHAAAYFLKAQCLHSQTHNEQAREMLTRGIEVAREIGNKHLIYEMNQMLETMKQG
ncbi:MAG: hypothetical protein HJJLKODD_02020 [Phycisphaerae bacterium]|nr:hypothetical protein [Phycisphaerae bacterium]